jgi:nitroreductase
MHDSASTTLAPSTVLEALRFRYATKAFDPARRIPREVWSALEESLVLAPSSFGLQPWKFVVVEDAAVRERLVAASWNQRQVAEASHLVVFAAREELGTAEVDRLIARMAEVRGVSEESLQGYRKVLLGFIGGPGHGISHLEWNARQAYIALGQLMHSAALLGLDTCPMEGIDPAAYDEILGLRSLGFRTVCACPVGYRAAADKYATAPKVRYPAEEVVLHV